MLAWSAVIQAGWGESGLVPAKLRCEYRENPLGIDVAKPRLSWTLESGDQKIEDRGQKQSAYQVLVASTEELLRKDKSDLWDSGEVASDQGTQVEYAGQALGSRMYCHWKVRAWLASGDKKGKTTDWSKPALWTMGLLTPADWQAKWIGRDDAQAVVPDDGKNRYLPATHLRKDFTLTKSPQRAVLYVTSLGIAEPHLNGHKVGEDFLIPGWTDYRKRIYYRAYDVTAQVHRGANTLGAILGDGWFRGHLSIIGQNLYGRETRLLAQLHVDYADGSTDTIASDSSWTAGFGPILAADLYAGETYDARLEVPGWDRPGFTNAAWRPVQPGASVHPSLQAAPGAPVQRTGVIQPVSIKQPKPGLAVVDFGRNFAGWIRLRVSAAAGTRITMRFGEMLNPDGTVYLYQPARSPRYRRVYLQRVGRGSLGTTFHLPRLPIRRGGRLAGLAGATDVHRHHRWLGPAVDGFLRLFGRDHDSNCGQHAVYPPSQPYRPAHRLPPRPWPASAAFFGWASDSADSWE